MAFDQATRGRLQKLVNNCRGLLSDEFTIQLQQTYGLDPRTGAVTPLSRLGHLDDRQRNTADVLRQTLAHYLGADADDAAHRIAVLDRMLREQAFTVLNRLAALLMMEARGQLIESVSKAYQSQGFQLYSRIAGTALGETGHTYQVYLFSVFDELARELPALFDRYAANAQLFPSEIALRAVLEELNHFEVAGLWGEDETLGWIYQYFNSKEERKAMRDASQAPRNSRELAVRNQFFTPRYVVEFLVDNTLGRLWFNATGGKSALAGRCQYLLIKPDEKPVAAVRLRDPRTLKLLDPACGSMHFGLYAFDLFLEIYREAWYWEQENGPGSLDVSTRAAAKLKPLSQTYAEEAAFLRDVPRLIIEHNIYGVDIDPRAAQIASLALWLRAQRAWHEAGVKAKERPLIARGHVLAAIAPPAEKELRQQFAAELDPLDAELFEKTLQLLKGLPETGVLLQVERELPQLIRQVFGEHGGLFQKQDIEQWQKAEARVRVALAEFAQAARSSYQGRLFANDALQGLRLMDLCREVFDVVVMNPPFGEPARSTKAYLEETLPRSKGNILTHFIERATQLVRPGGLVGAIVSRTCFFLQSFSAFRKSVLVEDLSLEFFVDLGQGVLDAMVETAAATWERSQVRGDESIFIRELNRIDKDIVLRESIQHVRTGVKPNNIFRKRVEQFSIFEDMPYVYWISDSIAKKIALHSAVDPLACSIRVGLQTGDDFRFLRLWWEIDNDEIVVPIKNKDIDKDKLRGECLQLSSQKKWAWYSKTEAASPIYSSIHMCVNWHRDGLEIKEFHSSKGDTPSRYVRSEDYYFLPAISYMVRSSRLIPYLIPSGVIPTAVRSQVYPNSGNEMWLAALLSSNLATAVARFRGGTFAQPMFQNSMVSATPFIQPEDQDIAKAAQIISSMRTDMAKRYIRDETEILFTAPLLTNNDEVRQPFSRESLVGSAFDNRIAELCGLTPVEFRDLQRDHNEALLRTYDPGIVEEDEEQSNGSITEGSAVVDETISRQSWAVGVAFGRFNFRLATGECPVPPAPAPFDPLPARSPGMMLDGVELFHAHAGILVDDPDHSHDIAHLVDEVLGRVAVPVPDDVRRWLRRDFFAFHLQRYSKSRRKAPIYWPLATTSGSYTLWLYYASLTSQTLYTAINDFVEPKLKQIGSDLATLRTKGAVRSRDDERRFEMLQTLELELGELRDTLLTIAPHYQPNHDDGVQITAAPLWPLFRHKPWQKILKETWAKLENGDYDWAHLAMNYWPDRVREKCKTDKSLAIAHGLEDLYVEPEGKPKKAKGRKAKEV